MEIDEVDTTNKFLVASRAGRLVIMNPPRGPIEPADALLLAAYLVAMVGDDEAFKRVLEAVQSV